LEQIKKSIPFAQAVVFTALPRGGLQVALPAQLPSWFAKTYADEVFSTDRLSWRCIQRSQPVTSGQCWPGKTFAQSSYARNLMGPLDMAHVLALPLAAPVLRGFPGSIHLMRTASQGAFTAAQSAAAMTAVRAFDQRLAKARTNGEAQPNRTGAHGLAARPEESLTILDGKLRPQIGARQWRQMDGHLKEQMLDHAKRRLKRLSPRSQVSDRVQFPDSVGNVWAYRVVSYGQFPALGAGPFCFFCLLPDRGEWIGIKPGDFQADADFARLIPAFGYMNRNYRKCPRLQDIARSTRLSPFHFHRRFAELLGLTPKQFMLDCQIHEAKTKLLAGKTELADIARDCGFSHQSHFTSRFKQCTGQTPTRWRRSVRQRA
jgi:AraC-like DNA-binding protein